METLSLKSLLKMELLKWKHRGLWIWIFVLFLLCLVPAYVLDSLGPQIPISFILQQDYAKLIGFCVSLILILGYGLEFHYDTIPLLLSQGFKRDDLLLSKLIFALLFGLAYYLLCLVVSFFLQWKNISHLFFRWEGILFAMGTNLGIIIYLILYGMAILFLFQNRGNALLFFLGYNLIAEELFAWLLTLSDIKVGKEFLPYGILETLAKPFSENMVPVYLVFALYLTLFCTILGVRIYQIPKK